jgi:hypothetical protein
MVEMEPLEMHSLAVVVVLQRLEEPQPQVQMETLVLEALELPLLFQVHL